MHVGLDDITRRLLLHSNARTFAHLTADEIQKLYIDQELKKEWLEFKNEVVDDVIYKYGVDKSRNIKKEWHCTKIAYERPKSLNQLKF